MQGFWNRCAAYGKQRWFLLLWSAWIVLFLEFLSRNSLEETLSWSLLHFPLFLLNTLVVGSLLLVVLLPVGNARAAFWVVSALTLSVAGVSGIKLRLKGLPLLPWDLSLFKETTDVVNLKDIMSIGLTAGVVLFLVASYFVVHRLTAARKIGLKERLTLGAAALLVVAGAYADGPVSLAGLAGGRSLPFDQVQNVRSNGFTLATVRNLRYLANDGLPGAATVAFVPVAHAEAAAVEPPPAPAVKPNVIIVLSESLWDPTSMKDVSYSRDPLPFLHSLQQRYPSGTMISPEVFGSTANVELEVLTGLSMRFLPDGVLAYEKYINRPVDSLASIFSRQGYRSTMISPWPHWFFNAESVYANLGFGKFISQEFIRPVYNGAYLADSEVARVIMDETEKSSGPDFVFANTAENHYGYYPGKFPQDTIQVTSGMTGDNKSTLESYLEGCSRADKMLQTLVEHYSASKEPTIIVFFGDHLPLLGSNYGVYREGKYITGTDDPDFMNKIYRVPLVVWNNFQPEQPEHLDFGTNFLGPYVLDQAKARGTAVTDFLKEQQKQTPILPLRRFWPSIGLTDEKVASYAALEQDILFGDAKAYGDDKAKIINPDYVLGYGPLTISQAKPEATGDQVTLHVTGANLPPTGVVCLDGQPLATAWVSYSELTATVPREQAKAGAQVTVRVPDIEKKETAVRESNTVTITQP